MDAGAGTGAVVWAAPGQQHAMAAGVQGPVRVRQVRPPAVQTAAGRVWTMLLWHRFVAGGMRGPQSKCLHQILQLVALEHLPAAHKKLFRFWQCLSQGLCLSQRPCHSSPTFVTSLVMKGLVRQLSLDMAACVQHLEAHARCSAVDNGTLFYSLP